MARSAEYDSGTTEGIAGKTDAEPGAMMSAGVRGEPLKRFLPGVYRICALLTVVGTIAARVAGADLLAVSFFMGSVIGLIMLYSTAWMVRRYITPSARLKRNRIRLMLLLFAKLPVLGVILYFVTSGTWFHPVGMLLGVSMVPFTLTLYGLTLFMRQNATDERIDWTAVLDKPKRS
jgi:hypothetical protein